MPQPKQPRSAALRHLHRALIGNSPDRLESLEEERFFADLARQLYQLRTKAGLTQAELAKRAHTTASVICRLEEADDHRCSLRLLCHIATALNRRVVVADFGAKLPLISVESCQWFRRKVASDFALKVAMTERKDGSSEALPA
ncbi:MAG: helix-turn-helix domain-containing protein [Candidatus Latescibacteria bacterium]|nr:helix-turn-helix domain-containing protein [Candidatus Latescibacterota bacterium]